MKKTLIALAVGSAFAAPAAFADVTISGAINMGVVYLDVGSASDQAGGAEGISNFGIATNYTNITISSMEDLGGGLKLDFAAQIDWNTAGVSSINNRNSHIGLVGDSWGGVWIGSNENLYERYFYTIDPLDGAAGVGGNLQMLGTPGAAVFSTCGTPSSSVSVTTGGSVASAGGAVISPSSNPCGYTWYRRDQSTIWYDSPNWNGFTFGVVYQTNFAKNSQINPMMWQVGAKYVGTTMPLELWGVYGRRKDQFGLLGFAGNAVGATVADPGGTITPTGVTLSSNSSNDKAWHIGAAYTLGDFKLFAGYEDLKYELDNVTGFATDGATDLTATAGNVEYGRAAWYLGAKWNLATGYVGAQFIQALDGEFGIDGADEDADDTGGYMIGLGYFHNMSKQTQAYVMGTWIDNDDFANYQTAGFGNAASGNLGSTQWALTVGLKHSF